MAKTPHNVGDILDCLNELADECDQVSFGRVMDAFGSRTFGPAIMVPALLELTPIGAIPGVPTFLALVIVIVAAQKLVGKDHLWIPAFIGNRCVSASKMRKATKKLRGIAGFMDRHFHRRFQRITRAPFTQIVALIVILLCATVPFLEVLPFASSVPMLAIAGFGLAILARDGVLLAIALAASLAVMGVMGYDYLDGGLSDTEATDGLVDQETVDKVKETADDAGEQAEEAGERAGDAAREMGQQAQEAGDEAEAAAREMGEKAKDAMDGE